MSKVTSKSAFKLMCKCKQKTDWKSESKYEAQSKT